MPASDLPPLATLEDARQFLEQRVYDAFRQTSEWPRARDFDLEYHDLLDPLGGLELICRQIGLDRLSCGSPTSESDRVVLRLPAVASCEGAEADIENFLAVVRLAADRYYAARGKEVEIKDGDLVEGLKIDPPAAQRALALILSDHGIAGGGSRNSVYLGVVASRMRATDLEFYRMSRMLAK